MIIDACHLHHNQNPIQCPRIKVPNNTLSSLHVIILFKRQKKIRILSYVPGLKYLMIWSVLST